MIQHVTLLRFEYCVTMIHDALLWDGHGGGEGDDDDDGDCDGGDDVDDDGERL